MTLPKPDPPELSLPPYLRGCIRIVTASRHTAEGKSSIQRDVDAGRFEAIEDLKYKLGCVNPFLVEKIEIEVLEYQDKLYKQLKQLI
jgi:hypothetical protein